MRSFAAGLLVWVSLLGLWFFFVFQFSASELVLGAVVSSVTLFALHRSLCAAPMGARLQPSWLVTVSSIPGATFKGLRILLVVLSRLLRGEPSHSVWQTISFCPQGDDPEKGGRRALATLFTTITPNTYVVGIDVEEDVMLIHTLENTPVSAMLRTLESGGSKS